MRLTYRCLFGNLALLGFLSVGSPSLATTIDFNSVLRIQDMPYTEAGVTFDELPGSDRVIVSGLSGPRGDGAIVSGTNNIPIRFRASSPVPFDVVSFDLENLFRSWRVVSSKGGIVETPEEGTVTVDNAAGWQAVSYIDFLHDPPEANGGIQLDNLVIRFVPEPASALVTLVAIYLGAASQRRR